MSGVWPCRAGGTTPPVATIMLPGSAAASRSRSTDEREGEPQIELRRVGVRVVERQVARPRRRAHRRVRRLGRHQVGQSRRVAHGDHVELVPGVGVERRLHRRAARYSTWATLPVRGVSTSPTLEHERVARPADTTRNAPLTTWSRVQSRSWPSPAASIAWRGCGPPSGRFITLMKYGAGAASRNSTVRSSSARTPIARRVVGVTQVVVLAMLEHEVDRDRRAGRVGVQHALDAELDVVGGERATVGPCQTLPKMEHVAKAVVGDLPPLGERRHDRALWPRFDEPVEQLHAQLDVRPGDRRPWVGIVRQEAAGDPKRGVGAVRRLGRDPSGRTRAGRSRWPPRTASVMCSASASLNSTSAISRRSSRRSRIGSSSR